MRMRMARLGLAGTVLLGAGMAIAACAPSPGYETAAAVGWASLQADQEPVATNELGRAVVRTDAAAPSGGTIVELTEPSVVTNVRVRCYDDGQTIWVEASVRGQRMGTGKNTATGATVACDLKDHVIALPQDAVFLASSVVLRAFASAPTAAVIAIEGSVSADPWEGYFDQAMADPAQQSAMSMYGTFGRRDEVQAVSSTDVSTPAGHHVVEFSCAGPRLVTVEAWSVTEVDGGFADRGPGTISTDATCPTTATLEIDTTSDGLGISADSHGEQGAFAFRVDPGSTIEMPGVTESE